IARDQELIDTITERLVEFWETNVVEGIEPVIDGSEATADFLKEKYADVEENQTALPSRFDELIEQKRELKRTKKEIESAIRQVDNEIISELGKRETSIGITQKNIISWKLVRTRRMNSKKLAEKYPDVANDEEIYNVTESRRLTEK
ncbi:TPA: endonuclease, partial [Enterococcus faecium]